MDIVEGRKERTADEFPVFVSLQGEGDSPPIHVKPTDTLREVLAKAGLKDVGEMLAFVPKDAHGDEDDEADDAEHGGEKLALTLVALGIGRGARIVCARCQWVAVTIQYQHETVEHKFRPSARVRRVLRWARKKWNLHGEDAESLKLRICGSEVDLKESTRLAELLTGHTCSLCMVLVPGPKVNG